MKNPYRWRFEWEISGLVISHTVTEAAKMVAFNGGILQRTEEPLNTLPWVTGGLTSSVIKHGVLRNARSKWRFIAGRIMNAMHGGCSIEYRLIWLIYSKPISQKARLFGPCLWQPSWLTSQKTKQKSFITCIDIIDVHENVESLEYEYEWNWWKWPCSPSNEGLTEWRTDAMAFLLSQLVPLRWPNVCCFFCFLSVNPKIWNPCIVAFWRLYLQYIPI